MKSFLDTPWVANEPLDAAKVKDVIPAQVQVAFSLDGAGHKVPVPITPAAQQLFQGPAKANAQKFFQGILDAARTNGAYENLRGMSLATDDAAFATNIMMSNVEAGYVPDSIKANDQKAFVTQFQSVANASKQARAQNTGWLDVGPKVSQQITQMIEYGAEQVPRSDLDEISVVLSHELQHAATPPTPKLPEKFVWMEEGIADTLAWWPTVARDTLTSVTKPPTSWQNPDPFIVQPDALPSIEYANSRQAVQGLLLLAGVEPYSDSGAPIPASLTKARELLQSERTDKAATKLAAAIAAKHSVKPALIPKITERIANVDGSPSNVHELERWLQSQRG